MRMGMWDCVAVWLCDCVAVCLCPYMWCVRMYVFAEVTYFGNGVCSSGALALADVKPLSGLTHMDVSHNNIKYKGV